MGIPAPTRNILAVILLVLAVLASGAAMLGSTVARVVDTPEPLQRILGPLATDPELRQVLPDELGTALGDCITEDSAVPQILAEPLEHAISLASGALLDEDSFQGAWEATVEAARTDFTTRLAEAAEDPSQAGQVTLRLELAPLLNSGYDTLQSSASGSVLGALLPKTIDIPSVMVDTGWPATQDVSTGTLNTWLAVARSWGWLMAGALVAAAAGILLGTRSGRGWAVLAGGAMALVLGTVIRLWFGSLDAGGSPAADPQVRDVVASRLVEGLSHEVGTNTTIMVIGGVVAMLAGGGWAWWVARQRRIPGAG